LNANFVANSLFSYKEMQVKKCIPRDHRVRVELVINATTKKDARTLSKLQAFQLDGGVIWGAKRLQYEAVIDLKFNEDLKIVRIRKGVSQAAILNQLHTAPAEGDQELLHKYDPKELVRQRECSIQVLTGFDASKQAEAGAGENTFGSVLHSDVLVTSIDFPTLSGKVNGTNAQDIDTRGCAASCDRLWALHEHLRSGVVPGFMIERHIEWDGEEALVYLTVKGKYSSQGKLLELSRMSGLDVGLVGQTLYGESCEAPRHAVLKMQWQIVFKRNSHKAVEVDVWSNIIEFLAGLGKMKNPAAAVAAVNKL